MVSPLKLPVYKNNVLACYPIETGSQPAFQLYQFRGPEEFPHRMLCVICTLGKKREEYFRTMISSVSEGRLRLLCISIPSGKE